MAYGKTDEDQKRISAFRSASAQFDRPAPRAARSKIPTFLSEYKPSTTSLDDVRLIEGEYPQQHIEMQLDATNKQVATVVTNILPFISYTKHYDGVTKRGCICSCGPFTDKDSRQPCLGCDIYWATATRQDNGFFESTRMRRQRMFVFSVWDYGLYHNAPQVDAHGNVKMNPRQNKPYLAWQKCTGQLCPSCRVGGIEWCQGKMLAWPLNGTQYKVLRQQDDQVGRSCRRCFNANCITSLGWTTSCCHNTVVDMATTNLKLEELAALTKKDYACQQCRVSALLTETYSCGYCVQRGQYGVRASLFDFDLKVMAVPGTNGATIQISGFSGPNVPSPELAARFKPPMDLIALYEPDSIATQEKLFNAAPAGPAQGQAPPQQVAAPQQQAPQYAVPAQYPSPQQYAPQYPVAPQYAPPPPQQPQYAASTQGYPAQPPAPPAYAPFGQPAPQAPVQPQYAQQPPATPYGPRQ